MCRKCQESANGAATGAATGFGYAVVDAAALSPDFRLGDSIETFIRREDAERLVKEVRGDDPELASYLRIDERELEAGGFGLTRIRARRSSIDTP